MHQRTGSRGDIETSAAVVAPILIQAKVRLLAQPASHRGMQIKVANVSSARTQNRCIRTRIILTIVTSTNDCKFIEQHSKTRYERSR
jgi:hypothetical protein